MTTKTSLKNKPTPTTKTAHQAQIDNLFKSINPCIVIDPLDPLDTRTSRLTMLIIHQIELLASSYILLEKEILANPITGTDLGFLIDMVDERYFLQLDLLSKLQDKVFEASEYDIPFA